MPRALATVPRATVTSAVDVLAARRAAAAEDAVAARAHLRAATAPDQVARLRRNLDRATGRQTEAEEAFAVVDALLG